MFDRSTQRSVVLPGPISLWTAKGGYGLTDFGIHNLMEPFYMHKQNCRRLSVRIGLSDRRTAKFTRSGAIGGVLTMPSGASKGTFHAQLND